MPNTGFANSPDDIQDLIKLVGGAPVVARSSSWVRSPDSGILRAMVPLGTRVKKIHCWVLLLPPLATPKLTSPHRSAALLSVELICRWLMKATRCTTLPALKMCRTKKPGSMSSMKKCLRKQLHFRTQEARLFKIKKARY